MPIDLSEELRQALRAVSGDLADVVRRAVRQELDKRADGDRERRIDVPELATMIGRTPKATRRWVERGGAPFKVEHHGRLLRFRLGDVLDYLNGSER